jgi:hypothetical protein
MSELWKRIIHLLMVAILAVSATAGLSGCEREGPGEEVGEAVDEAAEEAGDVARETRDEL